ncbi:MAG TPA: hypothetical protein VK027_07175 [Chitinophagaceae bacterium]|nr:hypothetical protein [Chitinophagaceae bacterium]
MRFFSFILTLVICFQVFSQDILGRIEIRERPNEPVKKAELYFKNECNLIIYRTITDDNGYFNINVSINEIFIIELNHSLFGKNLLYDKRYFEPLVISKDTLLLKLSSFDYTSTYPGEAKYYTDIDEFLSEKYSKFLDLKDQQLKSIPKLKKIKKHGVEALFLENNNISEIPKKIFKIKNLKYIDISGNPLNNKSLDLVNKWNKKGILIIF